MNVSLLELDKAGIHVAEYLTALPSKEVLRQKLQQASQQARRRLMAIRKMISLPLFNRTLFERK